MDPAVTRAYPNVLRYVRETPWAVTPEAFAVVSEVLSARLAGWRPSVEEVETLETMAAARPSGSRQGAVAVIPLQGMLVPRASMFSAMSGGTSVEAFIAAVTEAANDASVAAILLDVDSPGGSSDLIPEAADAVAAAAARKQVVASVNTMAASGAYWIASQCSAVYVTPSGDVGSIGCFAAHDDLSGMQAQKGVKTTLIQSEVSPYKTELSPYGPLSQDARDAVQARVDEVGEQFVAAVANGRGVDPATVARDFGAGRMVAADRAVAAGMADGVETFQQTLSRLLQRSGAAPSARTNNVVATVHLDGREIARQVVNHARRWIGPVPAHSTPVVDEPWDGGAVERDLPAGEQTRWKTVYAWYADPTSENDPDGDGLPDAKTDWKFPHHTKVDGPAVVSAVRDALARLTDAQIPEGDKPGVRAHLQRHLDDFHAKQSSAAQQDKQLERFVGSRSLREGLATSTGR